MNKVFWITFFLLSSLIVNGQEEQSNSFVGKWNVEIKGTPGGDSKMEVTIITKDGKLQGTVTSKDDGTVAIKKIENKNNSIVVYFKHGWFTVNLVMERIDANHCKCKLADRYNGQSSRQGLKNP